MNEIIKSKFATWADLDHNSHFVDLRMNPVFFLFAYFGRLSLRQLSCVKLHPTSKGEYRPALHNQAERRRAKISAVKLQQEHTALDNLSLTLVAELLTFKPKREYDGTSSLIMESGRDYDNVFILFCFS